jgi:hypothetical protein
MYFKLRYQHAHDLVLQWGPQFFVNAADVLVDVCQVFKSTFGVVLSLQAVKCIPNLIIQNGSVWGARRGLLRLLYRQQEIDSAAFH